MPWGYERRYASQSVHIEAASGQQGQIRGWQCRQSASAGGGRDVGQRSLRVTAFTSQLIVTYVELFVGVETMDVVFTALRQKRNQRTSSSDFGMPITSWRRERAVYDGMYTTTQGKDTECM